MPRKHNKCHTSCSEEEDKATKCCRRLGALIKAFQPTPICSLPFTITESGTYVVIKDLVHAGAEGGITITANDVVLDLNSHSITIIQDGANGIFVNGASNVFIKNGSINFAGNPTVTTAGAGIRVENANNVEIEHVAVRGTFIGIQIISSNSVHLHEVHLEENIQNNVSARAGSGLVIHDTFARNTLFPGGLLGGGFFFAGVGIEPETGIRDVDLQNIETIGSDFFFQEAFNVTADKIKIAFNDPDYIFSMFQLGVSDIDAPSFVRNAILKDSNFYSTNANASAKGVQINSGNGIIIDGITVNIDSQGTGLPTEEAGIKLVIGAEVNSAAGNFVDTVVVRNSVFTSPIERPSGHGVSIFANDGFLNRAVTLENNTITNQLGDGVIVNNSRGTVLKNNTISNSAGNGIRLLDNADESVLLKNIVQENGVGLNIASDRNTVVKNIVVNNVGAGLINTGLLNNFVDNLFFNNGA